MLWGSAFPLLKIGFSILDIEKNTGGKLFFAAYRFLSAGIILFLVLLFCRKPLKLPAGKDYFTLLLLGLLQTTIQYFFFYIGISNTTSMKASIITGSGSLFLAVFSHLWLKDDRLSPVKITGLTLGFIGIIIVNFNHKQFGLDFRLAGEGFIILTSLSSISALFIVKKISTRIYPPVLSAYQLTFGGIVLFGIACLFESPSVIEFSTELVFLLLYLSLATATAFSLWYMLIKHNKLSSIAVYRFLIPVCGTFLSAAILDSESFTWLSILSLILVSYGMITTSREKP
ncbi:MAG: DMT family transporter [Proteobacteria bacterium]|nr:DMT family transporter [Pseudomonadota bacterium]MBU4010892.1 DMT family transporter [Pseudomonadota bacterium]